MLDTIPSKRFDIWRRLYTRFLLEPAPASTGPDVGKTILPVTDADELLRVPRIDTTVTGTLTVGLRPVRTVPDGERWRLHAMDIARGSGDRTITRVSLTDVQGPNTMPIDEFTATGSYVSGLLPHVPVIDENFQILITIGGGATDSIWICQFLISVDNSF